MFNLISFSEAYHFLRVIYGHAFEDYAGNFGKDAFVLIKPNKKIPVNAVKINIAASAGDSEVKEPLGKFQNSSRHLGRAIAQKLKQASLDAVISTGGCNYLGRWVTEQAKKENPDLLLVSLSPTIQGRTIDPRNIPNYIRHL